MALTSDLSVLLEKLDLAPTAKEELLTLAATDPRTSEQTARLKAQLTVLRQELLEDYALMVEEENAFQRAEQELTAAEDAFEGDLALVSRLAHVGVTSVRKTQERDTLVQVRKNIASS